MYHISHFYITVFNLSCWLWSWIRKFKPSIYHPVGQKWHKGEEPGIQTHSISEKQKCALKKVFGCTHPIKTIKIQSKSLKSMLCVNLEKRPRSFVFTWCSSSLPSSLWCQYTTFIEAEGTRATRIFIFTLPTWSLGKFQIKHDHRHQQQSRYYLNTEDPTRSQLLSSLKNKICVRYNTFLHFLLVQEPLGWTWKKLQEFRFSVNAFA